MDARYGTHLLLAPQTEFRASAPAVQAYRAAERDYQTHPNIEVVLLGSDSLETIKTTHANYFVESPEYSSGYFDGVRALARRRHRPTVRRDYDLAPELPIVSPSRSG